MYALSFGELLVDLVCPVTDASLQEAPSFIKAPGGAPANVAVGLTRLGTPTRFVGQVGNDAFGLWLKETVAATGVDVSGLSLSREARTTLAFVATREDGKKDICFYRNPGADAELEFSSIPPAVFEDLSLLHCGSVSLSLEPCRSAQFQAVEAARASGALISFDPNWRPSLWDTPSEAPTLIWRMMQLADIVKVADEEWEFVTGTSDFEAGAKKILAAGPTLVVLTRGAAGAAYWTRDQHGEVNGHQVTAIDTLGAGDAFVAGLLHQILAHPSLEDFLQPSVLQAGIGFANACGALATQVQGAIPAQPTLEQVQRFLHTI